MNRLLTASLLPVVLASLGTVACTAETSEDAQVSSTTQSPAELLAGQAGTPIAPVAGYATSQTAASGRAVLVVDGTSYDLVHYSFGIVRDAAAASGEARDPSQRAALAGLQVTVRPRATEPVLRKALLDGHAFETAKIILYPSVPAGTKATPIELAVFGQARVGTVATASGSDSTMESYSLGAQKVTLSYAGANVTYDSISNVVSSNCGSPALPTYTQADANQGATFPIAAGVTRLDAVSVAVSNADAVAGSKAGTSTSAARLDGIALAGSLERGGVCAFYDVAAGMLVPSVRFGVAGAVTTDFPKPYESISWTACLAGVDSVQIASNGDGAPVEMVQLTAAGLLRTDRTIDAKAKTMNESSVGWSFAQNAPISTCSAVIK